MSPPVVASVAARSSSPAAGLMIRLVGCALLRALFLSATLWVGGAVAADAPLHSQSVVEDYLSNRPDVLNEQLEDYNRRHGLVRSLNGSANLLNAFWTLRRFDGDRVYLLGRYEVGQGTWDHQFGRFLFEFRWRDGDLELIGHDADRMVQDQGVTGEVDSKGCTDNYYAPNPCLGTVKRWTEFSRLYGLPLDRNSATIFQAFAQQDFRTGEKLLAAALGEPSPATESVYPLQAQVDALDLGRFQRNMENPCDLNAFGPKPCPQIERIYERFIRRHGLPETAATARMFAAYAGGNFRAGDTLYALAKGLPRPNYEEPTAGIGRDAALAGLKQPPASEAGGCSLNPYAARPCLASVAAWRKFRERYRLPDDAESARIFEAYATGDFAEGDQLFAEAKGVSLVQLLEAAGVSTGRLIIEVYPGPPR